MNIWTTTFNIHHPPLPPPPPPPIEELSILPPQKIKLFIPQERKFKVLTHFPLQNLYILKDQRCPANTVAPSQTTFKEPLLPLRFPRSSMVEGGGEVLITNGMALYLQAANCYSKFSQPGHNYDLLKKF